jgi:hypothetical protein
MNTDNGLGLQDEKQINIIGILYFEFFCSDKKNSKEILKETINFNGNKGDFICFSIKLSQQKQAH